jgi:hypothetical protein
VKQHFVALWVVIFLTGLFFPSCVWTEEIDDNSSTIVGVREFMKNVTKYQGTVSVEGVVSKISPKQKMLALIDTQEFRECKVVTCAQLTLPVRWKGEMPKVATVVRVDGEVRSEDGQRFFFARDIKTIKTKL